jgi:hypothetical protein
MVIWFEVAPAEVIPEHDHWHAQEHMHERLGIPGFLRGRRAITTAGPRKYFVTYEVANFDVLKSAAYHKCLNNPTPWTQKMMPHVGKITRSLCRVSGTHGSGIGQAIATIRFAPAPGKDQTLRSWLDKTVLPGLPSQAGMAGVHFLEALKQTGPQTNEQKLRGSNDAEADWVVIVEGYDPGAVKRVLDRELGTTALTEHGAAPAQQRDVFALNFALSEQDVAR